MSTRRSSGHYYKQKSNAPYIIVLVLAVALLILAIIYFFNPGMGDQFHGSSSIISSEIPSSVMPSSSEVLSSSSTASLAPESSSAPPASSISVPSSSPAATSSKDSDAVNDSYFNDSTFIGNSLIEGLVLYNNITVPSFCTKGMNVNKYYTEDCMTLSNGTTTTISEAVKGYDFKKIFIMFGINEIGWPYENVFVEKYGEIVDDLKSLYPDAKICIQSILPVTKTKSDSDSTFSNDKIDHLNQLISDMAAEKGAIYLNIAKSFKDENGALFADASSEGIHLTKEYYIKWYKLLAKMGPLIDKSSSGTIE